MLNQIYFSSTLMWNASVQEIFSLANLFKVGGIELWAEQAEFFRYNPRDIRCLAHKYDMQIIVHSKSWDLNFASLNKHIQKASLLSIKKSIDFAKSIGAAEITIHPPRQTIPFDDAFYFTQAKIGLEKLLTYSTKKEIPLSLEIMEKLPKELITTPETLKTILGSLYEAFVYTVDTAHCTDEQELFSTLAKVDSVSKIHISNKKGTQLHTPLYDGDFDFQQLFPRLNEYNVPMIIEGLDTGNTYQILKNNLDFIQNILKNPDSNSINKGDNK